MPFPPITPTDRIPVPIWLAWLVTVTEHVGVAQSMEALWPITGTILAVV
jgi:hypothetical protein